MAEEGEEVAPPEPVPPLPEEEFESRRELFNKVFENCNSDVAKLASINERKNQPPPDEEEDAAKILERENKNKSLTYSEISMETLHTILNKIKEVKEDGETLAPLYPKQGTFLDLGSGAGKACFAAGLLHPFEKVIGVETLQTLNDHANAALTAYQALEMPETISKPEFQFMKSDFVAEFEAMEALAPTVQVCLAIATCYRDDQLQAMEKFAKKMPEKSFFICLGQGLPDSCTFPLNRNPLQRRFVNVKRCLAKPGTDPDKVKIDEPEVYDEVGWVEVPWSPMELKCDWGPSKCFVYLKKPDPFKEGWGNGEGPWPQLVGLDKEEAQKKLADANKEARPGLQIELVDITELTEVTEPNMERVRIFFDAATGKVVEPAPKCE